MSRKLSNAQKLLLVTVLIVVMVLVIYVLIDSSLGKKVKTTRNKLDVLEKQYKELMSYEINKENNLKKIDEYDKEIKEEIDRYNKSANGKLIVQQLELWLLKYDMKTSAMSFSEGKNEVLSFEYAGKEYFAYQTAVNFSYNMTYSNFKKLVADLAAKKEIFPDDYEDTTESLSSEGSLVVDIQNANHEDDKKDYLKAAEDAYKQASIDQLVDNFNNISITSFTMSPDGQHGNVTGTLNCYIYTLTSEDDLKDESVEFDLVKKGYSVDEDNIGIDGIFQYGSDDSQDRSNNKKVN